MAAVFRNWGAAGGTISSAVSPQSCEVGPSVRLFVVVKAKEDEPVGIKMLYLNDLRRGFKVLLIGGPQEGAEE